MKHISFLFVLLFFVSLTETNAQNYGLDNTDPSVFTNFKVPDTDLRSIWFNSNLLINTNKSNRIYPDPAASNTYTNYSSEFSFNLNPHFFLLKESDSRLLSLNADLTGSYDHHYNEGNFIQDPVYNSKTNSYGTNLNLNLNYNNYINSGNVFYSAGSVVGVYMNDSKSESTRFPNSSSYDGYKSQDYTFSLGIGIGKLRNVTPVVTAVRFQERLKQLNMLNKDLSDKTIEDLAGQFYKQSYYNNIHTRPEKYFWQDVDKILSDDGVSLKDLNMYSDAYLRESLDEVRFLRSEGFIAGLNMQLNYQNRYSNSNSIRYLAEQLFTLGQAYINFSHQMNLNSQVDFNLAIGGGPNVIAHPTQKQQYYLTTGLGYNYELTDRLVATADNTFYLSFGNYEVQQKSISNIFNVNLMYFVEDNLSLNVNYRWNYSDNKYPYDSHSDYQYKDNNHSINIGFTYYIERGFLVKETTVMLYSMLAQVPDLTHVFTTN